MSRHRLAAPLCAAVCCGLAACGGGSGSSTILDTEKVERAIEQSIAQQRHIKATVSCPAGTHQKKGLTFTCTATFARGSAPFLVRQTDDNGDVTYRGS